MLFHIETAGANPISYSKMLQILPKTEGMFILRLILISLMFLSFPKAYAADLFDGLYNKLTQVFSSDKCQIPKPMSSDTKGCETKSVNQQQQSSLKSVGDSVFYNRLAELEVDRLKCAKDEWQSYSSATDLGKKNQEIMIAKINNILPDLQFLKNQIGHLVGELQLLRGRLPSHFENLREDSKYAPLKREYDEKHDLINKLSAAYELRLSEIPNSDNSIMREFIEDHLSTILSMFKKHAEVKPSEFEDVVKEMTQSFQNSINEVEKTKKGSNYDLSIKQQAKFSSDPALIGVLAQEYPNSSQSIATMQCSAKSRMQTKELVELGANVASLALPIGALAVAKAARAAVVLKSPQMARGFEFGGRGLGWAAVAGGGIETTKGIYQACYSDTKAEVAGMCKQSPQTLIEKHERSSCVWDAVLAAAPGVAKIGGGFLLKRMADKTTPMAQFVEKMSGRQNLRNQDLNFAGSLNNEDRVLAARGILNHDLTSDQQKALIRAHEVGGLKSFGQYSPEEINQKREILKSAGFSERETETLLWKGIAGFSKEEIAGLAKKRATEFFGKPVTDEQVNAILTDTNLMLGNKSKEDRLKKLTDVGFTQQQAQEIIDQKLQKSGTVSASRGVAGGSAATSQPVNRPLASTSMVNTVKPTTSTASAAPNPFLQNPSYTGNASPEALKRLSNGSNITDTEARVALETYAKNNKIAAMNQAESKFKAMEKLADDTFRDAQNAKKALESPRLSEKDRRTLTENYQAIVRKCKSLPGLASKAGMNGESLQSRLQSKITEICR